MKALDGVSLTVRRGETLGIVGESGCGKSTLARVIMRLLEPTSGTRPLRRRGHHAASREQRDAAAPARDDDDLPGPVRVAQPAQARRLIVGEPLEVHGIGTDAERKRRVQELLEVVGLNPEHYNRFPHEFSGGQRQRIGIARALAVNPKLIVARRARLGARRLGAGADPQPAQGPAGGVRAHLRLHRARPQRRPAHLRPRRGDVPRQARRARRLGATSTRRRGTRTPGALLSAVPIANPRLGRTAARSCSRGDVPNPINPPSGCRFHPRCPRARDACAESDPPLAPLAPGHEAACFFPLEKWPLTDAEMRMEAPDAASVTAADPNPPPVDVRLRR